MLTVMIVIVVSSGIIMYIENYQNLNLSVYLQSRKASNLIYTFKSKITNFFVATTKS